MKALEVAESCYSILVVCSGCMQLVLPYSHLKGAALEDGKCLLMHSIALVTIDGPPDIVQELFLLSKQRLATVRHGLQRLSVATELQDAPMHASSR